MSDDLLKYLRELRSKLDEERQGLVLKAEEIRNTHPGNLAYEWDAKTIEASARGLGIRSGLLKRVIDKRGRLAGVFAKAQKNPILFARAIVDAYGLVCRNAVIKQRKRRRKELEQKFTSTANQLLSVIQELAETEADSPTREPGSLERNLRDALKSIDSDNKCADPQYSLSDCQNPVFAAVMSIYLDIPEQSNPHGNFIRSVDIILRCTYAQEAILQPGIDLSHSELAALAEICLDLPLGSVNPKSIGQKRAKLEPQKTD